MTVEEMNEVAEKIDSMILDILVPARVEKRIGEKSFNKLIEILDEINRKIHGSSIISRKLSSTLFFIYCSLISEAQYCEPRSPFFMQVAQVEDCMAGIFGDTKERKTL
ncbi:hypothetical protein LI951_02920 [Enterococcus sp. BWT-B8]|uniref:hypothetical protein n=1 Tax=Enterococcus sp. BWT-B8 TaxID=2885157 RepID=UPI001E5CDB66|nr:hypothetical protein [Enterococcus sp. BWT-B8]MCB5951012.1 hypothetical protein [Enterococcus sp. BWT-B8]